jgi:hypothetical protein
VFNAGEAIWNLRLVSTMPPPPEFVGAMNSDLAFKDHYAIQGNFNGVQVWDISNPRRPVLVKGYFCPASQSDVSVYGNLLFTSGENLGARLDCGAQGVPEPVSHERIRGIRMFDITDIRNPRYIGNVQTCRGSHTHTLVEHPNDRDNIYIYISGSAPIRPTEELAGCFDVPLTEDSASARFRIEVIRVPLAHPEQAAVISKPRIFQGLSAPPEHGMAPDDLTELAAARRRGAFIIEFGSQAFILGDRDAADMLDSVVTARGGSGAATAADSNALRALLNQAFADEPSGDGPAPGPTQCHDITVFPSIGLAGGACGGYGLLLDISDPVNPVRIDAASDSNFSYWHSATLNHDGTKLLFTDEWGGGSAPKCRANDPKEWGANAIFSVQNRKLRFESYYKLPVPQTPQENCVAHNGSLIPIPGRDVMAQGWYQGGISVFDWTDPKHPVEIAFHDRGPLDPDEMLMGGSWSVYWYNGLLVSSEIARGLDIFELTPSPYLSQNEIDAAKSVRVEYQNSQGQRRLVWPPSFTLARAYVDQIERANTLPPDRIANIRRELTEAEGMSGAARGQKLTSLADGLSGSGKIRTLADAVRQLAGAR